jgi:hypothetical protein
MECLGRFNNFKIRYFKWKKMVNNQQRITLT